MLLSDQISKNSHNIQSEVSHQNSKQIVDQCRPNSNPIQTTDSDYRFRLPKPPAKQIWAKRIPISNQHSDQNFKPKLTPQTTPLRSTLRAQLGQLFRPKFRPTCKQARTQQNPHSDLNWDHVCQTICYNPKSHRSDNKVRQPPEGKRKPKT